MRAIYLESKLECSFFVFLTLTVTKNLLQHMKMFNLNLDVPFTNRLEKMFAIASTEMNDGEIDNNRINLL